MWNLIVSWPVTLKCKPFLIIWDVLKIYIDDSRYFRILLYWPMGVPQLFPRNPALGSVVPSQLHEYIPFRGGGGEAPPPLQVSHCTSSNSYSFPSMRLFPEFPNSSELAGWHPPHSFRCWPPAAPYGFVTVSHVSVLSLQMRCWRVRIKSYHSFVPPNHHYTRVREELILNKWMDAIAQSLCATSVLCA